MRQLSILINTTPVVLAFTPNYFVQAATCLVSILKHSGPTSNFHVICLLSEPLTDSMAQELEKLDPERLQFTFLNLQGKLGDIYINERYTVAASYRLILPDLLPEYDKVIYIDCDVIVRNDLAKLYKEIDLQDNYMAGVFEATLDLQLTHMKAIGCEAGTYINSGFLVMNLSLLRQDSMVQKFLEASKADYLEFPDQDVINQLCKGRILGLPPYYNSIRTFYLPQYKAVFLKYYNESDWEAIHSHGTIHYTGGKPWDTITVEFSTWWKYYNLLPKAIKEKWIPNKRLELLAKLFSSNLGKFFFQGIQSIYRSCKYSKKTQ